MLLYGCQLIPLILETEMSRKPRLTRSKKEEVLRLYADDTHTLKDIVGMTGISKSAVSRIVAAAGVQRFPNRGAKNKKQPLPTFPKPRTQPEPTVVSNGTGHLHMVVFDSHGSRITMQGSAKDLITALVDLL